MEEKTVFLEKPEEILLAVKELVDVLIETIVIVLKGILAWS